VKVEMTCWKWFGSGLKEAGVEVTDKNQKKVDDSIHHYVGERQVMVDAPLTGERPEERSKQTKK
jgi:hypothetical protein